MRRILGTSVVVGCAILAVWWLGRSTPRTPPAGPPATATIQPDAETRRTTGDAQRTELPAAEDGEASAARVIVHVVGPDGAAVAGADVAFRTPTAEPAYRHVPTIEPELWRRDAAAWALRHGTQGRTDAQGIARLPIPQPPDELRASSYVHVYAFHAGCHARTREMWRTLLRARVELRLERDVSVEVRVRGADGQPVAGVPVELHERHHLGVSDAAGRLVVPHAQTWFSWLDPAERPVSAKLVPRLPGMDHVSTTVSLRPPPPEPAVLHLPPCGRVVVVAPWLATAGDPGPYGARARIRPIPASEDAAQAHHCDAPFDGEGQAVFPYVALARDFRVEGRRARSATVEFRGPHNPGEEVRVELERPERPVLIGRLLADGAPLAERTGHLRPLADATGSDPLGFRTDAAGRFRADLPTSELGATWSGTFFRVVDDAPRAWEGASRRRLQITFGELDAGDVQLDPIEPLVSGRIAGLPEEGAAADCVTLAVSKSHRDELRRWRAADVTLADDGHFRVYAPPPTAPIFLHALPRDTGYLPVPPIACQPGQHDLVIELRAGGAVRVTLVADDPRLQIGARARLLPDDGRSPESLRAGGPWREPTPWADRSYPDGPVRLDGERNPWLLQWHGLPPGRYRLEIGGHGTPAVIQRRGIIVTAGDETDAGTIDLAGRLQFTTLRVTLPAGWQPSPHAQRLGIDAIGHLYLGPPGALAPDRYQIDGKLTWFAAPGPSDVVLEIPGCRREVVHAATGEQTVTLERGIPLRITWADAELDAGDLCLRVTPGEDVDLHRGGHTYSPAAGGALGAREAIPGFAAPAGDTLVAHVTAPGTWRLSAERRNTAGGWQPVDFTPTSVHVPAEGTDVALRLR